MEVPKLACRFQQNLAPGLNTTTMYGDEACPWQQLENNQRYTMVDTYNTGLKENLCVMV